MLREHPDTVEADLQRFYTVDIRDRHIRNDAGVVWLPLRRLWVLISSLPAHAATAAELRTQSVWSIEAHLLDDLRMVWTGSKDKPAKPHPDRPRPKPMTSDPKKLAAARRRRDARRKAIESGEIPSGGEQ